MVEDADPPEGRRRLTHEMPQSVYDMLVKISTRDVRTVRQTINFILIRWLEEHEGFRWAGQEPTDEGEDQVTK